MGSLSDLIEQYLCEQLKKMETLEIQRRELARMFRCVPSQINYVLETRFTMDHGYMVQSRRGGGGFIRITRINWKQGKDLPQILKESIGATISEEETVFILERLVQTSVLSYKGASFLNEVLQSVLNDETAQDLQELGEKEQKGLDQGARDHLRALVLRALLLFVCGRD